MGYKVGEYIDIDQVKSLARVHGSYFFEPNTMRFFKSRILSDVVPDERGWRFCTSEKFDELYGRRYTARHINFDGDVRTLGEFYMYTTAAKAKRYMREYEYPIEEDAE